MPGPRHPGGHWTVYTRRHPRRGPTAGNGRALSQYPTRPGAAGRPAHGCVCPSLSTPWSHRWQWPYVYTVSQYPTRPAGGSRPARTWLSVRAPYRGRADAGRRSCRRQLLQLQALVLQQQLQAAVQLSCRAALRLQTLQPLHQTGHLPDRSGQGRSGQVSHSTRPATSLSGQVRAGQIRHSTRPATSLPR